MHYRAITEKALELGLLDTEGRTPEATMYAQILTEINYYRKRSEQSRYPARKGIRRPIALDGAWPRLQTKEQNKKVRGSLGTHEQGLIITTSDFGKGARDEAARPDAVPVALMNGEQLVALLAEHEIGVNSHSHDLLELGDDEGIETK